MTIHRAHTLSDEIADRLACPSSSWIRAQAEDWRRQSLAHGLLGIALLHVERAAAGLSPWQRVNDWLAAATRTPLTTGPDSHPFHGAPALAHVLACAARHMPGPYEKALAALDRQIATDVHRRLAAARRRIASEAPPALAEFDSIRGLTGYGAYLLRSDPSGDLVRQVLEYLVHLTTPISHNGRTLPGWWTLLGPSGRADDRYPGGHANTGVAHGIGGVLALLALAARQDVMVDGHRDAIHAILAWLDRWQFDIAHGVVWPYWVTRSELEAGRVLPPTAQRPSWCYGAAGVARAQQLAGLALGDVPRQLAAETSLIGALTDPSQIGATAELGLCHGFAGLAHIAARAADDALPGNAGRIRDLIPALLTAVHPPDVAPGRAAARILESPGPGTGLLDGAAGIALAVRAPATAAPPRTAWDACLLIA
ncbi:lanthionine synthetase C family protein [Streptomyces laurentii]|uniref:lanthionine synthetase C family protein n=1 Tax=Streptomyces laurentii TaxID=39478 RepID=UPI0033C13EB4